MPHQISIINLLYFISRPCKVLVKTYYKNIQRNKHVLSLTKIKYFIIRQQPQQVGY
jgi:hypothetical protein